MAGQALRVRLKDGHAVVRSGDHACTVSAANAPEAAGPCPKELLGASLGSCIVLTLAAVADNKGIRLERLAVDVCLRTEAAKPWQTTFDILLDLGPGLDARERAILSRCAAMCDVHKILSGQMQFNVCLKPDPVAPGSDPS